MTDHKKEPYPCRLCQLREAMEKQYPHGGDGKKAIAIASAGFVTGVLEGATHMTEYMNALCEVHAQIMAAAMAEYAAMQVQSMLRQAGIDVEIGATSGQAIPKRPENKPSDKLAEVIPLNKGPKKELN